MKLGFVATVLFCLSLLASQAGAQTVTHVIGKFKEPPKLDGVLEEWGECNSLKMSRPKVEDLTVDKAYVSWDDKYIYVAMSMHDKSIVNDNPVEKLHMADAFDFRIARTTRDGRPTRLLIAPTTAEKKPGMMLILPDKTKILDTTGTSENGIKWATKIDGKVWSVEAAIPAEIPDIKLKVGASFPFVFVVWDRDATEKDDWDPWWRRSEFGNQKKQISTWPMLILQETAPQPESAKPSSEKTQTANKQATKSNKLTSIALDIPRRKPCNLFEPGESVQFMAYPNTTATGNGKLTATVTDYFGKTVVTKQVDVTLPVKDGVPVTFEKLPRGYFEMNVKVTINADQDKPIEASEKVCFAVADLTQRTASEVRQGGYRFGMKMSYMDKAWWAGNATWDEREVVDAICKLGMQWTRVLLQQTSHLATEEIVKAYPMNAIFKVERFPKEMYDESRYGPMAEYEAKYGRGSWTLKTLPMKAPYQAWLKEELAKLPAEQNVFEVWNEAWDKMSPEDLAEVSNWIVEAILEVRPDAIIGANLRGSTSKYEYDAKFIDAGGMKGMKMVALHPYSGSEDRLWMRDYKKWISERAGRPIDIYITEYGSHSCPEGPAKRSENEQAQRVVRQSLALYAEDVRAFTPHWVGQREQNPTYHEDWFGFIRLNHEPKPALVAHAVSGRMVDASRYVGDLFYDQAVESMLFERNGVYTLALWTKDESRNITVKPGVAKLTMVDMVGKETAINVSNDELALTVTPDLIYLVGVSPKLAEKATTALDPLRWAKKDNAVRIVREMPRTSKSFAADGKISEWDDALSLYMANPKVNGDDASGQSYFTWDQNNLYIAVAMRDNEMLNKRPLNKIYQQDSIELFISTEPRDSNPGYGPNDFQFMITPTSMLDKPLRVKMTDREAGKFADVSGDQFTAAKTSNGWIVEFAIPWSEIGYSPKVGSKLAMELRVNDADTSHERWKIDPDGTVIQPSDPSSWSHVILK